ncbi:MAG: OmpA family protein [Acidobacteriota bacterium]
MKSLIILATLAAPLTAHADPAKLELHKLVTFDDGRVYVHTDARYSLRTLARVWKDNHAWTTIRIEGNAHVDDEEAAIALGQRRADMVKTWLVRFGVDPKYIESVGNSRDDLANDVDVFVEGCGSAGTDCRGK